VRSVSSDTSRVAKTAGKKDGDQMAKTTLEIIRGLQQAFSNSQDSTKSHEIGLRKEEEISIHDRRVTDGFGIKFTGDKLFINYSSEIQMKEAHNPKFESDILAMIGKVKSFLQKEYKAVTGDGITLSPDKDVEPHVLVQYLSRVRSQVTASQCFKIGGVKMDEIAAESEETSNPDVKKLVGDGEDKFPGAKKPENVTVKKSEQEKK
jgi:hypothetical protein